MVVADALRVPSTHSEAELLGTNAYATQRVLNALSRSTGGLNLNDLATAVGGSVGVVSTALMFLELRGMARFSAGRWHPGEVLVPERPAGSEEVSSSSRDHQASAVHRARAAEARAHASLGRESAAFRRAKNDDGGPGA